MLIKSELGEGWISETTAVIEIGSEWMDGHGKVWTSG